jgi:hypothetical protein
MFILNSLGTSVLAYTYGDPSEETVAIAYREMLLKLEENPPNFEESKKIYNSIREEIDMHMGEEPSKHIDKDIQNKDKEQLIKDMEQILVLNIARRLVSIEKDFKNYDVTKRLIAKANATYKEISPVVEKKSKDSDVKIKAEFNKALEAIGNPGLFGVGEKKADLNAFNKSKDAILNELQSQFNLEEIEVGHFTETQEVKTNSIKNTDWTDLGNIRNWLPLIIIVGIIIVVVIYSRSKKR